jgi:hypothetical protein
MKNFRKAPFELGVLFLVSFLTAGISFFLGEKYGRSRAKQKFSETDKFLAELKNSLYKVPFDEKLTFYSTLPAKETLSLLSSSRPPISNSKRKKQPLTRKPREVSQKKEAKKKDKGFYTIEVSLKNSSDLEGKLKVIKSLNYWYHKKSEVINGEEIVKVMIGKFPEKEKAEQVRRKLLKENKILGVVSFLERSEK